MGKAIHCSGSVCRCGSKNVSYLQRKLDFIDHLGIFAIFLGFGKS